MNVDSNLWYVRDGDDVTGPFTAGEMATKRRSGDLQWFHEVSQDQLIWISASSLADSALGDSPSGGRSKSSTRRKSRAVKTTLMVVAGVPALLGLGWLLQDQIPGFDSKSKGAAILRVLQENDEISKQTVTKAGIKDVPSEYVQAIDEYVTRISAISLVDCPANFRVAFKHYIDSWEELRGAVRSMPDGVIDAFIVGALNGFLFHEMDGGMSRLAGNVKQTSKAVKLAFQEVERIAAEYDVAYP